MVLNLVINIPRNALLRLYSGIVCIIFLGEMIGRFVQQASALDGVFDINHNDDVITAAIYDVGFCPGIEHILWLRCGMIDVQRPNVVFLIDAANFGAGSSDHVKAQRYRTVGCFTTIGHLVNTTPPDEFVVVCARRW